MRGVLGAGMRVSLCPFGAQSLGLGSHRVLERGVEVGEELNRADDEVKDADGNLGARM